MNILIIIGKAAGIAFAGGAAVYCLISAVHWFRDLISDAMTYREWCEDNRQFYEDKND